MGHGDDSDFDPNVNGSVGSYPIASFDLSHVQLPLMVASWVVLVAYIKTVFHYSERVSKMVPESCLLVVLGIGIGACAYVAGADLEHSYIQLDSTLFFMFLLPPIVFDAGYFMPVRLFFENLGTILLYALFGTLWNTISIGLMLYAGHVFGWYSEDVTVLVCFLFSSLISAVDPVAVLAVFEEIHVNEVLYILVFGESLLNDAITVVLYHMMENFSRIGEENLKVEHFASALANFFCVSIGGVGIGAVFGLLASFTSKFTDHVRTLEPIYVFGIGYISYLIAELFHFSGILAIVTCGMLMSQYVERNISHKSHTTVKYFLKMMASISESIIFLFLGLATISKIKNVDWGFLSMTLVACLLCRFVGTYLLTFFANFRRTTRLDFAQQFIMAYGGIRGAVAFCLAASLEFDIVTATKKDTLEATTLIVIFFTVFVQGITIKPLVKLFQIKRSSNHDKKLMEIMALRVLDHTMNGLEQIAGMHGDNWFRENCKKFNNHFLKPYLLRVKPDTSEMDLMQSFTKYEINEQISSITKKRNSSSNLNVVTEDDEKNLSESEENVSEGPASPNSSISEPSVHLCLTDEKEDEIWDKNREASRGTRALLGKKLLTRQKTNFTISRYDVPDSTSNMQEMAEWAIARQNGAARRRKRFAFQPSSKQRRDDTHPELTGTSTAYQRLRKFSRGASKEMTDSRGQCELTQRIDTLERQESFEIGPESEQTEPIVKGEVGFMMGEDNSQLTRMRQDQNKSTKTTKL